MPDPTEPEDIHDDSPEGGDAPKSLIDQRKLAEEAARRRKELPLLQRIVRHLAPPRVPMLIVQGEDDQYGTVRQIEMAQEECYCPVEVALLPKVKHVPHREAPERTLSVVADFCTRILNEHEGSARKLA